MVNYVIIRESGEYSDYSMEVLGLRVEENRAKKIVDRLNAAAVRQSKKRRYYVTDTYSYFSVKVK